ncbi:MAG: ATPase, partial [Clostridia bacterium]|nr:ATPase [Clostridia bacterium]
HLDKEYWRPGWQETSKDEWQNRVKELICKDSWIMDGNYGGTMDIRFEKAETVIFLDLPTITCTYSILKRWFIYRNKTRPDVADGCNEKIDLEFFLWVWNYKRRSGPKIIDKLDKLKKSGKNIIIFKTRRQVNKFIKNIN